jgi:hypothetical protein
MGSSAKAQHVATNKPVVWKDVDGELRPHIDGQDVVWAPQPGSQQAFLACPLFEVLYEGTRGPGKTDALLMDFAQHVGRLRRGLAGRPLPPDVPGALRRRKQVEEVVPAHLAAGVHVQRSQMKWRFPGGEELMFRHFRVPDDYWSYHGHAYPWIAWEELTTWADDKCFKVMMSCSRSTRPGMPRKYRATTNPYGVGHNWVKARFRCPCRPARSSARSSSSRRQGRSRCRRASRSRDTSPRTRSCCTRTRSTSAYQGGGSKRQRARGLDRRLVGHRRRRHVRRLLECR